jgi:hypothetical protein
VSADALTGGARRDRWRRRRAGSGGVWPPEAPAGGSGRTHEQVEEEKLWPVDG